MQKLTLTGEVSPGQVPGGGAAILQEKTVNPSRQLIEVTADEGYDYLSKVNVAATALKNLTITPTAQQQVIDLPNDAVGYGVLTVEAGGGPAADSMVGWYTGNETSLAFTGSEVKGIRQTGELNLSFANAATIGDYAFTRMRIKSISAQNKALNIGAYSFNDSLFTGNIEFTASAIGTNAFSYAGIKTITVNGDCSVGEGAFQNIASADSTYCDVSLADATVLGNGVFKYATVRNVDLSSAVTLDGNTFERATISGEVDLSNYVGVSESGMTSRFNSINLAATGNLKLPKLEYVNQREFYGAKIAGALRLPSVKDVKVNGFANSSIRGGLYLDSVETFGNNAFSGIGESGYQYDIYIGSDTVPTAVAGMFASVRGTAVVIHVPAAMLQSYLDDSVWAGLATGKVSIVGDYVKA